MTTTPTIQIDTVIGIIEAKVRNNSNSPGIQISVNGALAAVVEYAKHGIVIRSYSAEGDAPITCLDFDAGEVFSD